MTFDTKELRMFFEDDNRSISFYFAEGDYQRFKVLLQRAEQGQVNMAEMFGLIREISMVLLKRYQQLQKGE